MDDKNITNDQNINIENKDVSEDKAVSLPGLSNDTLDDIYKLLNDYKQKKDDQEVYTVIDTPSGGQIVVHHTVSVGQLIIATVMMAILIHLVLSSFIRR